jgi:hypothetical protein
MDEIFEELISLYSNPTNVTRDHVLAFSVGNLQDDQKPADVIQKILNFNYELNSLEQICYKIDSDVVSLLIKNKADINAKDNLGNTPLYYAIETQNIEMVRLLTSSGAVISHNNYRNRSGKSPLEYAWDNYCEIANTVMSDKYEICNNSTKKLLDTLKKKSQYHNNIPKYSKMILPMALYLLNHQIYILGKGYPNDWSYDTNKSFETSIGMKDDSILPLLGIDITDSEISKFDVPNAKSDDLRQDIEIEEKNLDELVSQLNSFTKEFNAIRAKMNPKLKLSGNDDLRMKELDDIIKNHSTMIKNVRSKLNSYNKHLNSLSVSKSVLIKSLSKYISDNKHKLQRSGSVEKIYESVFINVLNSDFDTELKKGNYDYRVDTKTYPTIWRKYFDGLLVDDYTQILDLINNYQKTIIGDSSKSTQQKIRDMGMIEKYYHCIIVPFSKNYSELPREYNASNYALTIVIDIITHIVKRIIFSVMFGLIIKIIIKYVLMIFPNTKDPQIYKGQANYQKYVAKLVTDIINDRGNENTSRLMKYIFDVLPLKVVKIILQIYEGENEGEDDIDRIVNLESLFLHISKIIGSTTVIDIKDDSSLLTNLKDYVYPYYIDYLGLFVKEMKLLMDNYLKSLQYQHTSLEILSILSTKI